LVKASPAPLALPLGGLVSFRKNLVATLARTCCLGKSLGEAIRGFKKGLKDDEIEVNARNEQLKQGEKVVSPDQTTTEVKKDKV
jgi:hypothetical protein